MKFTLQSDIGELAKLAAELEAYAERESLPLDVVQQLNLALDELITNTITHGYRGDGNRSIEVEIKRDRKSLHATLTDDASPFNPFETNPPDVNLPLEERKVGGLGVFLVRQLMDDFSYSLQDGRNCVRLRKSL